MFVCVFQGGCLMAVGLGVAAAGFAGEHICFGPLCIRAVRYGQKYITIFWFFFFDFDFNHDFDTNRHALSYTSCFCTSYLFLHILLVLHILFCNFLYSITHFTLYSFFTYIYIYIYIYMLLWCYFYIIFFFALSTERTWFDLHFTFDYTLYNLSCDK